MAITDTELPTASAAPTLVDVASRAGVNKVTASIVLSGGQGNTRVSQATRERILSAAQDLHYQPNALARSLRSRRTHTIGLYLSDFIDFRDLFLSQIISGLQQGCELNRHDFLMHGTFRGRATDEVYSHLLNGKIDGLVLHIGSDDPLLQRLASSRLPVIAVANPIPEIPSVTVDDAAGSEMLLAYLLQRGHQRIVYAASPFHQTSAIRRHKAFLAAADAAGVSVTSVTCEPCSNVTEAVRLSADDRRPTAVVCWNDQTAYQIIAYAENVGFRVPQDLAVAGFDGISSLIPTAYNLTTIRADWRDVAKTAVDLLCRPGDFDIPAETVLPVEFVQGETA